MAVVVSTTYSITPDTKTLDGYKKAIQALIDAGAPVNTIVLVSEQAGISITTTDPVVRAAIGDWAGVNVPTQPLGPIPVNN